MGFHSKWYPYAFTLYHLPFTLYIFMQGYAAALNPHTQPLAELADVVVVDDGFRVALDGETGYGAIRRFDRQAGKPYVLIALLERHRLAGSIQSG